MTHRYLRYHLFPMFHPNLRFPLFLMNLKNLNYLHYQMTHRYRQYH
jgi:hypothetical protein